MILHADTVKELRVQLPGLVEGLTRLQQKVVAVAQALPMKSPLREQLAHGVGRRLSVIRRSVQNIFTLLPPDQALPLDTDTVTDVQINLHAFVMNLYGLFDNLGWAFVLKHGLDKVILDQHGKLDRKGIGLFAKRTRRHLPKAILDHLTAPDMEKWHTDYAKDFRDALAHRIPPYVPPAVFTPDEGRRYNELEDEKLRCILEHRWERLDEVWAEQGRLGKPGFTFVHAYTEEAPARHVYLHPQLICDGLAVVEFGELFLQHWGTVTTPP